MKESLHKLSFRLDESQTALAPDWIDAILVVTAGAGIAGAVLL